eukprot:jgi/Botrbrau1/5954/Bobra.0366s0124.1
MGRSKRERKQKALGSLISKHRHFSKHSDTPAYDLESVPKAAVSEMSGRDEAEPPTEVENGEVPEELADMLPPRAKKQKKGEGGPAEGQATEAPQKRLSKSQKRKLRRVEEERAAKLARAGHLANLAACSLPPEHFAVLQSASRLGQRESKRERLRRALAQQRLGLEVPEDSDLYRVRRTASDDDAEPSDDSQPDQRTASDVGLGAPPAGSSRGSVPQRASGRSPPETP